MPPDMTPLITALDLFDGVKLLMPLWTQSLAQSAKATGQMMTQLKRYSTASR